MIQPKLNAVGLTQAQYIRIRRIMAYGPQPTTLIDSQLVAHGWLVRDDDYVDVHPKTEAALPATWEVK